MNFLKKYGAEFWFSIFIRNFQGNENVSQLYTKIALKANYNACHLFRLFGNMIFFVEDTFIFCLVLNF